MRTYLIFGLFLSLAACGPSPTGDAPSNSEAENSSTLLSHYSYEHWNLQLDLPQNTGVFETDEKLEFNLNPDGREIRQFSLRKFYSDRKEEKYNLHEVFENGNSIMYHTFEAGVGSGGTEFGLEGIFFFEGRMLKVNSIYQIEAAEGNPEFCFEYLKTLKGMNALVGQNGLYDWGRYDTTWRKLEDACTSDRELYRSYFKFVNANDIGKEDVLIGEYSEHNRTFLGTMLDSVENQEYYVVKDFWTLEMADGPRGHSNIIFLREEGEICAIYDAEMPDNLPLKIEDNFLVFKDYSKWYFEEGLPSMLCNAGAHCFVLLNE